MIVEVVRSHRAQGAFTLAITADEGSTLAKAADVSALCHSGVERAVAATKTYTTELAVLALLAAPAFASPKTICVPYTGKHDYTSEIQKAFDAAVKAGPGSIVQLGAGHFYANNIVVTNFDGTFRGAGEGRTVIDTLRGLYPNGRGVTETGNPGYYLLFFLFRGGDVRVSDLGFDITATSPAAMTKST